MNRSIKFVGIVGYCITIQAMEGEGSGVERGGEFST